LDARAAARQGRRASRRTIKKKREDDVLALLKRAKFMLIIPLALYVVLFAAGYIAGKGHLCEAVALKNSSIVKLSSGLEYKVPGYGTLLGRYKSLHDARRNALLFGKNYWGIWLLIFTNNFFITDSMTALRAIFVVPVLLNMYCAFFQGVVLAQTPFNGLIWLSLAMEFGGYVLTIGATLSGVFWIVCAGHFGFQSRKEALRKALTLFVFLLVVSGGMIAIGSMSETLLIKNTFGSFGR
jgi:hypothetical protein